MAHFNRRMVCACGCRVELYEVKDNGDEVAAWICGLVLRLPAGDTLQEEKPCKMKRSPVNYSRPSS